MTRTTKTPQRISTFIIGAALALGGLAQAESPVPAQVKADRAAGYDGVVVSRSLPGAQQQVGQQGGGIAKDPLDARQKGAAWLVMNQQADGGWGAGGWGGNGAVQSDVATTSVAVLALLRDNPKEHRGSIDKGVAYVIKAVDTAPKDSPRLNTPQGTQPQRKLGELADTHFASLMLGEARDHVSPALKDQVTIALDTVIGKVQLAQKADGSFDGNGWAPVLSNSVAAMGLMRAKELGRPVDDAVLDKAKDYQDRQVKGGGGGGGGGGGVTTDIYEADLYERDRVMDGYAEGGSDNAGVDLYSLAGALNTAEQNLDYADESASGELKARASAVRGRIAQDADAVIAGFGSVGGEEMLSYMMISDGLAKRGGSDWETWETKMGGFLMGIQNADGSWAGHHCITSPVFVTAGAVLTLGSGEAAGRS